MNETIKNFDTILEFIDNSNGLRLHACTNQTIQIVQNSDGKSLRVHSDDVEEVIQRTDESGDQFLQVNFVGGSKILLTGTLVGFKPATKQGLDMNKLPRVVTTPDLISVVEAIEESIQCKETGPDEVETLKDLFTAVLDGGEAIGFDLSSERIWLDRMLKYKYTATA